MELIEIGNGLCGIVDQVNKALGPSILNIYCYRLIILTGATYCTASQLISGGLWSSAISCLICVYFISIDLLCTSRLLAMAWCGQGLQDEMKECGKSLENLHSHTYDNFRPVVVDLYQRARFESKLSNLKTKLLANPPIQPCSAFNLTSSNLLATCATILTYLVVLIQFKIAIPSFSA